MTLQNKILNKFPFTNKEYIKEYEAIADEFAIEFGEWLLYQDITVRAVGIYIDGKGTYKNTDELLEIYKKEKGL